MTQILIVDDDRTSLRVYARMLADVGETILYSEPDRALEWAHENDPQLVIVDYQMPEIDGLTFIRRLRADLRKSDIPIIMFTGEPEKSVRHEALRCGASAFLSKPVDAMELQTYAANLVTARRARVAAARQAERTRRLFNVASSAGKTAPERLRDALEAGIELLGLDAGSVHAIVGDDINVVSAAGTTDERESQRANLEQALARHVIDSGSVLALDDLSDSPWRHEVASDGHRAYIAAPFDVFGAPYGVLAFGGRTQREIGFDYADRDFVRLMSALVATTVEAGLQAERLDALAFYDTLTGLPNRNLLKDRLERTVVTARRQSTIFALLYVDLDGFKAVNDGFGHAAGDEVLAQAARRLENAVRESDTVGRLGGDEFVVLQTHLHDPSGALVLADRLIRALNEPYVNASGELLPAIGASIGISVYPAHGTTADEVLTNADAALYAAKNGGRGRACYHSTPIFDSDGAVWYDAPVAGLGENLEPSETILR